MAYFIIIRGALGVGKTTVARKLAKELDAEYVSMDEVLDQHGLDKSDPEEGCIPARNFLRADELVMPVLRKRLAAGRPVILDGCFYHKEQIEDLKEKLGVLGARGFVFTLKASLEVCIERDKGRELVYGKGAAAAVYGLVSRFDYGTVIETGGKTPDEVMGEIVKAVRE